MQPAKMINSNHWS